MSQVDQPDNPDQLIPNEPAAAAFVQDAKESLSSIMTYLAHAIDSHDFESGVGYYAKRLDTYLGCRYPMSTEQRAECARLAFRAVTHPGLINLTHQRVLLHALTRLVKRKTKDPNLDHVLPLSLDWRPMHDLLLRTHYLQNDELPIAQTSSSHTNRLALHANELALCICKCRRYFAKGASQEIWQELSPKLVPSSHSFFMAQGMLTLFMPTNEPDSVKAWMDELMESGAVFSVDACEQSTYAWVLLFARFAKHTMGLYDWSSILPRVVNKYLQSLSLPVGKEQNPRGNRSWPREFRFMLRTRSSTVACMSTQVAKLLCYTMTTKSQSSSLLAQLLQSVSTFLHPSNVGGWSHSLGNLLYTFSVYYAKRWGTEQRGHVKYAKVLFLPLEEIENSASAVQAVRRSAMVALYSKSPQLVNCSQLALRALASVHPQHVLPDLVQTFGPDLTGVGQSHRTLSALRTLSLMAPPLLNRTHFPEGATYLPSLLNAALDGIDPVDVIKTTLTFSFYRIVFQTVPFVDPRDQASLPKSLVALPPEQENAENEEDARTAGFMFGEFAESFLEQVIKLLRQQESSSKKDRLDAMLMASTKLTLLAFFQCLSAPIYDKCMKQVVDFITSSHIPAASKHVGVLVKACAYGRPASCLDYAFPKLLAKVAVKAADGSWTLAPTAKSELNWALKMLSQLLPMAGTAALPYLDAAYGVVSVTWDHKEKDTRNLGGKVLRNALKALTSQYVLEQRPLSSVVWPSSGKESWKPWQAWAAHAEVELGFQGPRGPGVLHPKLHMQWHTPSEEEMAAAEKVILKSLQPHFDVLQGVAVQADDSSLDSKVLERAVHSITTVLRGCSSVLGAIEGEELPQADGAAGARHTPLLPHVLTRVLPTVRAGEAGASVSLRTHTTKLCTDVFGKLLAMSKATDCVGVKVWAALLKLLRYLVTVDGYKREKHHADANLGRYQRSWQNEYHRFGKTTVRPLLIQREQKLHERRISALTEHGNTHYSQQLEALRLQLVALSTSDYSTLRAAAELVLVSLLSRHQHAPCDPVGKTLDELLAVLAQPDAKGKAIEGVCELLSHSHFVSWITQDASRAASAVAALCESGQQHKDDKAQVAMLNLFKHIFVQLHNLPIAIPLLPGNAAPERNAQIDAGNKARAQEHEATMIRVLGIVSNPGVHWRFQLMGSAFLLALLRGPAHSGGVSIASTSLFQYFSDGLTSNLVPMRRLSIWAVSRMCAVHRASNAQPQGQVVLQPAEVLATLDAIKSPDALNGDAWSKATFLDSNWQGWTAGSKATATVYQAGAAADDASLASTGLSKDTLEFAGAFFEVNMASVVKSMVQNHPSLSKTAGARSGSANHGAGEAIVAYIYNASNRTSPPNRWSLSSAALDDHHVLLARGLTETFPSLVLQDDGTPGVLTEQLLELAADSHEDQQQCTAAEIFAGVVQGSRHWEFEQQQKLQSLLSDMLEKCLAACQLDCIVHWRDGLRLACSLSDPRRVEWMTSTIIAQLFSADRSKSSDSVFSHDFKWLRFTSAVLTELDWRGAHLSERVFEGLTAPSADGSSNPWLASPFRQVREAVAAVLSLACRNFHCPHPCMKARMAKVDSRAAEWASQLAAADYLSNKNPSGDDDVAAEEGSGAVSPAAAQQLADGDVGSFLETGCLWLASSLSSFDLATCGPVFEALLPQIIRAMHHPAPETAVVAKSAARFARWASTPPELLQSAIKGIKEAARSSSWHVRCSSLGFLSVFLPLHSLLVGEAQQNSVLKLCARTLSDTQVDVRLAAFEALTSVLMCVSADNAKLQKKYVKLARTPLAKKSKASPDSAEAQDATKALASRQAGVFGLSAMVAAHPYTLPDHLPGILGFLTKYAEDPAPIRKHLRNLFAEFKRTHKDEWARFKTKFTEDELDALGGMDAPLSYFA